MTDYAREQFKNEVARLLEKEGISAERLENPPKGVDADISFPCFALAKEMKKSPVEIAKELATKIKPSAKSLVGIVSAAGPYVNFSINQKTFPNILLSEIDEKYGFVAPKKKALVEHTSINPNASPHVGRSRNAILGDSIVRILKHTGYDVETHYWVNDIGKQIALLVIGCSKKDLEKLDFEDMLQIYRDANAELEKNPEMEKEIFALLQKMEAGDKKTTELFQKVSGICVEGQRKILKALNIDYDFFDYESEQVYKNKVEVVMKALEKTGRVITDEQNRKVLKLDNLGLPEGCEHMVIARSDGTSMYTVRDIGYTLDKVKRAKDMNVVVLGEDHQLHFKQLSAVIRLLGYEPPRVVHYAFILLPTGKMSTRKGEVVLLEDFMKEAYDSAFEEMAKRYPELAQKEREERAKKISIAAVRYGIVKVSPEKNIIFNLADAIKFEGDTGPYLQYTYARANSILSKERAPKKFDASKLSENEEIAVLRKLSNFPEILAIAAAELKPHYIAVYLHELADAFNTFYQKIPVLKAESEEIKAARLHLVLATKRVLSAGLGLLGIDALEEM